MKRKYEQVQRWRPFLQNFHILESRKTSEYLEKIGEKLLTDDDGEELKKFGRRIKKSRIETWKSTSVCCNGEDGMNVSSPVADEAHDEDAI